MKHGFTNPQAEEAVRGWVCANGTKHITESFPELSESWFCGPLRTIFTEAAKMDSEGKTVNNLSLTEFLHERGLLFEVGPSKLLPGDEAWSTVEFALHKLKDCYERRLVAGIAKKMSDGMPPVEAITLLEALSVGDTGSVLKERRFDINTPPLKADPRLYLAGQGVCTAGNISLITGQAKSGKSAIVSGILATCLDTKEYLAVQGIINNAEHGVIHFDTEQSRYDHHQLVRRSMQRAGVNEVPSWLRSYSLADIAAEKRRKYLAAEIATVKRDHGGVHLVIVDGVADLCLDPNDPKEAFALVEELHRLAIKFDCPIIGILHLNPGSEFKTRGHLGSQLERKAESVIALEKDKSGDTITMFLKVARHGHLAKDSGPRFAWDHETARHELVEGTRREIKAEARREKEMPELMHLAEQIVGTNGPRKYGDFIKVIRSLRGATESMSEGLFSKMRSYGIISKDMLGWGLSTVKQEPLLASTEDSV